MRRQTMRNTKKQAAGMPRRWLWTEVCLALIVALCVPYLLIRPAHGLSVHGNGAAPDERADRLSASDIFICQKFIQSHVRIPFLYLRGGFRCNEMRAVRRKTVHEAILGF